MSDRLPVLVSLRLGARLYDKKFEPHATIQLRSLYHTSGFRIPQAASLSTKVSVDKIGNGRAKRLLLVRANPDEIPG